MAFPNQIPRVDEIIVPGIAYLQGVRPTAASFVQSGGRYADIYVGWKAQARLAIAYLVDQVISARIGTAAQPMATGNALTELCASEFDTTRTTGAIAAVGTFTFFRPPGGPGGAIPKGFRIRRDANPNATPPVPAALYQASIDTPWNYNFEDLANVPFVASKPGAAANAPSFNDGVTLGYANLALVDTPFDPSIVLNVGEFYDMSGGLDSEVDADLIAQASAYATGQFGPTVGAILAGALRGTGVHRVLVRDIYTWDDSGSVAATTGVCIADASWAAGPTWIARVAQSIADNFQGFGQSITVSGVNNVPIRVDCAVTVRDANSLSSTTELLAAIQAAVKSYFDDRPDWYTFVNPTGSVSGGLRSAIAAADRRLLTCTSATVYRVTDNTIVAQPMQAIPLAIQGNGASPIGFECTHWYLVQNGVNVTFAAPS